MFVDRLHGWLFSFPDLLFRTVDGGKHWSEIHLGGTFVMRAEAVPSDNERAIATGRA
jgi:photosystem II stability/assembly factor-like uncharacterized protein